MRRRWHLVLLFLLIGATLNLAVAWMLMLVTGTRLTTGPAHYHVPSDEERALWQRLRRDDMTQTVGAVRNDSGGGLEILHMFGDMHGKLGVQPGGDSLRMEPIRLEDHEPWPSFEVTRLVFAGWPLKSFEGRLWATVGPKQITKTTSRWCLMVSRSTGSIENTPLPYFPLWFGLAVNSVLYAAVAYLPVLLLLQWRRYRRIRRGLCGACGYPVGLSDRCTECGAAVNGRRTPALAASTSHAA